MTNLLLQYLLGVAAVARGFSQYVARIIYPGDPTLGDKLLPTGNQDWLAFVLVLVFTGVVTWGVQESAFLVTVLTVVHLALLTAVIAAEFSHAQAPNLAPFVLGGADNLFAASALLLFTFVGFDVIANAAEEAQHPEHIPRAMLGVVCIAATTYVLLSLGLALMVPFGSFGLEHGREFEHAAYSTSFLKWADMTSMYYIVCVTAILGIMASILVGLYGSSRIVMVAARDWLLPPFLATIYPRTQTPLMAHILVGVVVAILALLVPFETLSDLVSLGTVLVMWMVGNALLFRRYFPGLPRLRYSRWGTVESAEGRTAMPFKVPGARLSLKARQWLVVGHLVVINLVCLGLTAYFQNSNEEVPGMEESMSPGEDFHGRAGLLAFALLWALSTLSFQVCCPLEYEPPKWHIPWWAMPWLPSLAILLLLFTIGSLQNRQNYAIFACWLLGCLCFYLLFSLPMGYLKHSQLDFVNTEQMNVVELTLQNGEWGHQPHPAIRGPLGPFSSGLQLGTSLPRHPSRSFLLASQQQPSGDSSPLSSVHGPLVGSAPSQVAQRALGSLGLVDSVESKHRNCGKAVPAASEDGEIGTQVDGDASNVADSTHGRGGELDLPPTPSRQGSLPRSGLDSMACPAEVGSLESPKSQGSRGLVKP
ncbi:hypothetical protein N2152v2_009171 [Parachlorella kessleri]